MGSDLVMPFQLAGIRVQREDAIRIEVVAGPVAIVGIGERVSRDSFQCFAPWRKKLLLHRSPPGNHRSIESGCLALPNVLAAGARHRLRRLFLCHRLLADGTIFAPHIGSAFSSTNTLQRSWARQADRSLRRILPAVAVL